MFNWVKILWSEERKMDYTEERKLFIFYFFLIINIVSLAFYVPPPRQDIAYIIIFLHLISAFLPTVCALLHVPTFLHRIPPPTEPPPVPRFSPSMLLSDIPTGTLALSSVPLPSTGEWSLITVHGLCDEMPLAHLTSSCRLPLTSHCLCALQTVFCQPA